jgi:hypothetical protein
LSGYLPLLRAYVGQGLRGDLARFEGTDNPASASTHERAGNTDYVSQALRYAAGLAEEQVIPAEPVAS